MSKDENLISDSFELYSNDITSKNPLYYYRAGSILAAEGDSLSALSCIYTSEVLGLPNDINLELKTSLSLSLNEKLKANTKPVVAVLIPCFECDDTIDECVESVLQQEEIYPLIVLIDDNRTASSSKKLFQLSLNDNRISYIRCPSNIGPFSAVNLALNFLSEIDIFFDYFIKHDADDLMLPNKLSKQSKAIASSPTYEFSTCGYRRVLKDSGKQIDRKRKGHNMTLYTRNVFTSIGYFDSTRYGGDSEYLARAIAYFGVDKEVYVNELLTTAYSNPSNLTATNPLGSKRRTSYAFAFKERIHHCEKSNNSLKRNFDRNLGRSTRVTPAAERMLVGGVATLPERQEALCVMIESIIDQLDVLYVYQNGYRDTSGILGHRKVKVFSSLDTGVDQGDAGKFYKLSEHLDDIYFSLDDDLIYPNNYVDTYVRYLSNAAYEIIVCSHGRVMVKDSNDYYKEKSFVSHFLNAQDDDLPVHYPGTGTTAFVPRILGLSFESFERANMADIWVGVAAFNKAVPMLSVKRCEKWIKISEHVDTKRTIYSSAKKDSGLTSFINELVNYVDYSQLIHFDYNDQNIKLISNRDVSRMYRGCNDHEHYVVAIPSYNRPKLLKRLLTQLSNSITTQRVSVEVFDDGGRVPVCLDNFKHRFFNLTVTRYDNHGKKRYWELVAKIFTKLRAYDDATLYFYLGDDLEVVDNFFEQSATLWDDISRSDEQAISINLLNDGREQSWTNYIRHLVKLDNHEVFKSQWLDMIMMFDYPLLCHTFTPIPLSRWERNPNLSSGVGQQLSLAMLNKGYNMYQCKNSLVLHGDHDSEMNPEERKLNPLITKG